MEFVYALVGTVLFAAGFAGCDQDRGRYSRLGVAVICVLAVIGCIVYAAVTTFTSNLIRFTVISSYLASAIFLGDAVAGSRQVRRAGDVLVDLGNSVTSGFKIIVLIAAMLGLLAVIMQLRESIEREHLFRVAGQAFFFLTFGLSAWTRIHRRCSLNENGILGPNSLIRWDDVLGDDWVEPTRVMVRSERHFFRPAQSTLKVPPEQVEAARNVLSMKTPGR